MWIYGTQSKKPDIQMKLDDRFLTLPSRAKNALRNSRLGHFGDEIFPLIDPDDFIVLYSDNGRGPSYIQGYVGLYLLHLMLHETADDLMPNSATKNATAFRFEISVLK